MRAHEISYVDVRPDLVILIPVGSVEQHGPHLPLTTDLIIAQHVSERVERELADEVLLYPPICYSCSMEHMDFPGTIYVSSAVLIRYANEVLRSIVRSRPRAIVLVNAHGGNVDALNLLVREWNYRYKVKAYHYYVYNERVRELVRRVLGDVVVDHGGIVETSIVMAIDPRLVRLDRIVRTNVRADLSLDRTSEFSSHGVVGVLDERVSAELGRKIVDFVIQDLCNVVRGILKR